MRQCGRPSADSIAAVPVIPGERPPPPSELGVNEAEEWRAIVGRMPADWFPRETHLVLIELCHAIVLSRRIAAELAAIPSESLTDAGAYTRFDRLVRLKLQLSDRVGRLATKLRLTNQSRYGKRTAFRC